MYDSEPSALQQRAGGPCGVLAPVQGRILRMLLKPPAELPPISSWRQPGEANHMAKVLVHALADILHQCAASAPDGVVTVVWQTSFLLASFGRQLI